MRSRLLIPGKALAAAALLLALSGCAASTQLSGGNGAVSAVAPPDGPTAIADIATGNIDSATACRRLTGRIQVRILQIRDRRNEQPSLVSRAVAWAMKPFHGASSASLAGESTVADVRDLQTYNRALAQRGCPSFDLAAELANT
ncbi:MAG: hypothetical protein AAFO62_09480, partial [Pseudomonadota bacterium]